VTQKADLSKYTIPDEKKRRGSFVVRQALRRVTLRQHRSALLAAAHILLLLPIIQGVLLVGVLNAELWMLLLCVEGLLISLLAAWQLKRPVPENRAIGYGVALLNIFALSLLGLFLGAHVLWVTGLLALFPISWLVLAPTGKYTVRAVWGLTLGVSLILLLFSAAGRFGLEHSKQAEPEARLTGLRVAWTAGHLRGMNDTERALMRLRMAQAALHIGDYQQAFDYADDGAFTATRSLRPIPEGPIGEHLLDGLLRVKAQAYYNLRWDEQHGVTLRVGEGPLDKETLRHPEVEVRWGW
jgi:hypothetical protein